MTSVSASLWQSASGGVAHCHPSGVCGAGVLFRAYPEPWQVLSRRADSLQLVHTQDTMPALKDVALNILSGA